jgi:hypothetical protein
LKVEDVVSWSGWVDGKSGKSEGDILTEWAKGLTAEGGGDYPEAAKTALKYLMALVTSTPTGRETLVLWYTDSPPHHRSHRSINRLLEIAAHNPPATSRFRPVNPLVGKETSSSILNQQAPHPDIPKEQTGNPTHIHGESCTDWVHLSRASKEVGLRVYTILPPSMTDADAAFWVMLGTITEGGTCAIGGRCAFPDQQANRESVGGGFPGVFESYDKGGGDFVKAVTKLSLGIVLSVLVGGVEGAHENQGVQEEGETVERRLPPEDWKATLDGPLELENVRWISYTPFDTQGLLRTGKHGYHLSEAADAGTVPIAVDTKQPVAHTPSEAPLTALGATETTMLESPDRVVDMPAWKTALVSDEDDGSQGFLTAPWTIYSITQTYEKTRELAREGNTRTAIGRRIAGAFGKMSREGGGHTLHFEEIGEERYWNGVMAGLKGVVAVDIESISMIPIFADMWKEGAHSSLSTCSDS